MTEDPQPCPDCGAPVGQLHFEGCDVVRCKWTGRQYLSCTGLHEGHCALTTWTGTWPAEAFALSQGWMIPGVTDAITGKPLGDLNRVYIEQGKGTVVWDPELEDFKLREQAHG